MSHWLPAPQDKLERSGLSSCGARGHPDASGPGVPEQGRSAFGDLFHALAAVRGARRPGRRSTGRAPDCGQL
ncbi:MAG: hypothetical protein AMK75_07200 [Planctomycetes bacterium SM23_65]|nr:MAG: hypothetical protein AMK75_07200 [Planctomycetes bacterium SM23_65]